MDILKKNKYIFNLCLLLLAFNSILYVFIIFFHQIVPFQKLNYFYNAHHYLKDPQVDNQKFDLLQALGQYDSQWYLKIADKGYPFHPTVTSLNNKSVMDGPSYAFFPLYPLLLIPFHLFTNITMAAFIATQVLYLLTIGSLFYVVKKLYNERIAAKTLFLLFLFPFSIFYRSYFTEGLYLLLLIWFSYFLIKKCFFISTLFLTLLNITKGNGLFLNIFFIFFIWREIQAKKTSLKIALIIFLLLCFPFFLWILFCYFQTGNPFYFYFIRKAWYPSILPPLIYNSIVFILFPLLPLHHFHYSQLDIVTVIFVAFLLIKSKHFLHPILWWIAFILWLNPLVVTDTMSFTRYQITTFPLFIYGASLLRGKWYIATLIIFGIGLFITSLFFVNWYWLG